MKYTSLCSHLSGFFLLILVVALTSCGSSSSSAAATPPGNASSTHTSAPPAATVIGHSSTPLPALTPPSSTQSIKVTMADNGRSVLLKQGQVIFVALDDAQYDRWVITTSNMQVLTQQAQTLLPPHTQISYQANAPGKVTIIAKGDLICAKNNPPCLIHPRDVEIYVIVQ